MSLKVTKLKVKQTYKCMCQFLQLMINALEIVTVYSFLLNSLIYVLNHITTVDKNWHFYLHHTKPKYSLNHETA